jgi:UDP-N-acetylenolpyruvoylglucosamine reductase
MISEHNSNFIIIEQNANDDNETKRNVISDVKRLIQLAQDRVLEKTDLELEPSIRIW